MEFFLLDACSFIKKKNHLPFDLIAYLMASESMCTGAILSSRNFTISRNGFEGCLGNVSFRVISLWKNNITQRSYIGLILLHTVDGKMS